MIRYLPVGTYSNVIMILGDSLSKDHPFVYAPLRFVFIHE
jgi:hypothetical protein